MRRARPGDLGELAAAALEEAAATADPAATRDAVRLSRQALDGVGAGDPRRLEYSLRLSDSLRVLFERTGELPAQDEAVALLRSVLAALPFGMRPSPMISLAAGLLARSAATGSDVDLDEAVEILQGLRAVTLTNHEATIRVLTMLDDALHARYERTRRLADLDEAIKHLRYCADVIPPEHPSFTAILANLSHELGARYLRTEDVVTLDEYITAQRRTLRARPAQWRERTELALTIERRYRQAGSPHDLDEAVTVMRQALADSPGGEVTIEYLDAHGVFLREQYTRTARLDALNEAIEVRSRVTTMAADSGHAALPEAFAKLAGALYDRYQFTAYPDDLARAAEGYRRAAATARDDDPQAVHYLANLASMLRLSAQRDQDPIRLDDSISAYRAAAAAAAADDPELGWMLSSLGNALWERYESSADLADLDEVIAVRQQSVTATRDGDPARALRLSNLANALYDRHKRGGTGDLLDAAVAARREAVRVTPDGDPEQARCLSYLSSTLYRRYTETEDPADLEGTITAGRQALTLPAGPGIAADTTFTVGHAWLARWLKDRSPQSLSEAVDCLRSTVRLTPGDDPEWAIRRAALASALSEQHALTGAGATGAGAILDEIIAVFAATTTEAGPQAQALFAMALSNGWQRSREPRLLAPALAATRAAAATAANDPGDHTDRLTTLGALLSDHYRQTGAAAALEEAATILREVVAATASTDPKLPERLNLLSGALKEQFRRTGSIPVIEEAVRALQAARAVVGGNRDASARYLANIDGALHLRYLRTGELSALNEAIEAGRQALAIAREDDPERGLYLSNLGGSLRFSFERTGDAGQLDQAVRVLRAAVGSLPGEDPRRAMYLSNLGAALSLRYQQTGELAALTDAVDIARQAVAATPGMTPMMATRKSNLGSFLRRLFERTGETGCLEEAVRVKREALSIVPDSPDRPRFEANLGGTLQVWSQQTGDIVALEEGIAFMRNAVAASAGQPAEATYMANLGGALIDLAERAGNVAALDEAVGCLRRAVALTPDGDHDQAGFLVNLGTALRRQYARGGQEGLRAEAFAAYQKGAGLVTAPPATRINAATQWGSLGIAADSGAEALAGFAAAVELLPRLVTRQLHRPDAEHWLAGFAGLASQAAACALAEGDAERALVLLEQGRGILLAQAMSTRGDLTALREHSPAAREMADAFERLSRELDGPQLNAGWQGAPAHEEPGGLDMQPEPAAGSHGAEKRKAIAAEIDQLAQRIRSVPGFGDFLLPPSVDDLKAASRHGPVVVVNVSGLRCDALIVTPGGVRAVPLSSLTAVGVQQRVGVIEAATTSAGADAEAAVQEILAWLWDTIAEPVLDALGLGGPPADGLPWPHVWWVATGLLSLLPLHAAGHHGEYKLDIPRTVIDRAVSSYSPTISALAQALARIPQPGPVTAPIVVAMAETPSQAALPGALEEARILRAHFPSTRILTGPEATHDTVISGLDGCRWVHLACHGHTERGDPSASRLLVHDHQSRPLSVAEISRLRLRDAELAYLSACSTTDTSPSLADEAIHITAGFQLAGFPRVIGTLWPIRDVIAVIVTRHVYAVLTRGTPDASRAAFALHDASRQMRDRYWRAPTLWAAYIHAGI